MWLTTHLGFDGRCEEAFRFYQIALGGEITHMLRYEETPALGQMPVGEGGKIIHARMKIGDLVLMGADAPPGRGGGAANGFVVSLGLDAPERAEASFAALGEGGVVVVPMGPTFFAHRFGMVNDKFGVPWMVLCETAT